jgi:hypothetical protein
MQFKLFFKRKSDGSNVKSLRQLNPKNLKDDESAEIYRIESETKTDYETRVCKWMTQGSGKYTTSYPYSCKDGKFDTEKEMKSFVAKTLKRKVSDMKEIESSDDFVGQTVENFQFPSELDLEFDHEKIKKYRKN